MTTEEKVKSYDEMVQRIKELHEAGNALTKKQMEIICPELAESEDEKIRKSIESVIRVYGKTQGEWIGGYDMDTLVVHLREAFSTLEKQKESLVDFIDDFPYSAKKEQKPVEPIEFDNEFENQVSHLLASVLNGEHEYNEGFVKHAAQSLLGYAKNELKGAEQNIAEMSDDDRIRNWIKKEIVDKYVEDGIVNSKLADDALGWLEKQKHLYETTKDRFYREGFEEGQLYERQKEPVPVPDKFSGLKSLMLQYLQSAANRKDDAEIEDDTDLYGRKILDYVWKYDEKQKEQNSSALQDAFDRSVKDYSLEEKRQASDYAESILPTSITYGESKDEYKLHKIIEAAYIAGQKEQKPYEPRNWPADKDNLTQEQKPAEWSEDYNEDNLQTRFAFYTYKDDPSTLYLSNVFVEEASRNHGFGTKILIAAEKVAETIGATTISLKVKQDSPANAWYRKNGYGYVAFEDGYDWLEKEPRYMKPNKQEWNEEDKQMMDYFERLLEYAYNNDPHNLGKCCVAGKMWLKSLRPQSQWKPNNEQMKALHAASSLSSLGEYVQRHLWSLYEQLKKLM